LAKTTWLICITLAAEFNLDAWGQSIQISDWNFTDSISWKNLYPQCGWGQQSPIDIPKDTIPVCLDKLRIENLYWPQNNLVLQNNYRSAKVVLDTASSYPILVSGGPLPKGVRFYATGINFHVGNDDTTGADHTLQGVDYPMEMKIILSTNPASFDNATLAALSFFAVISNKDNDAWEPIIQGLSQIRTGGTQTTISFSSIAALLPPYSTWEGKYVSYLGTWAIPPCYSKVVRLIFTTFIRLSERQIHAFRLLQDENGRPITNNVRRPIPTLDYRAVLHTSTPY